MNPPSNTPPNVPGGSNLPPSGASGGMNNYPPAGAPPPRRGGGLFSGRNLVIGIAAFVLVCCVCGGIGTFAFFNIANRTIDEASTTVPSVLQTQIPQVQTRAPLQLTSIPNPSGTRPPVGPVDDETLVKQVGTNFMTQLKNANWAGAYALCTPDLQNELGNAAELGKRVTNGRAQPSSWTFETVDVGPDDAQIDGTAVFTTNRNGTLRLVLDHISPTEWKISGFNLQPK